MSCAIPRGASRAPAALAVIAAAMLVGACSRGEPQSTKARPNAPIEARVAKPASPGGNDEVDAALKERLARQDAAARMFERNVLEPAPPKVPDAPREAPVAREPPPAPVPPPREAPKPVLPPETAKRAASVPATPPPAAPASAAKPAAPPRADLASAKPAAAPAPEAAVARLITRVDPDFPPEAVRAGVERGTVRARLTLDAAGNVTQVEVLEADPRRVFDRAVVRALSQWKFTEGAAGRSVDSEVAFRR
jgi:periplasmic protein TonB